jgi:SNF2 family DNA or RNA helicase
MKTQGMSQQLTALKLMDGRTTFALLMEQGTGKTWTLLADAERLYAKGAIDAVFVVAPNGVHTNWVNREIPTHMEGNIIARAWRSGAGVRHKRTLEDLMKPRQDGQPVPLRVLAMNIDALITKSAFDFAYKFVRSTRCLIILDESHRIKNPKSGRTEAIMKLRPHCRGARIATGTPITNAPVDVFAQFEFLESGLLGTTSYRAFVAEYADVLPATHPLMQNMVRQNPRAAFAQIVAKNPDGSPRWRNLDKLQSLVKPHSYRVLKKDCLDLPDKVYKTITFELDSKQQKAYEKMRDECRIELDDNTDLPVSALSALMKLQQITSGFVNLPGAAGVQYVTDGNPRLKTLLDVVQDIDGKFIVWAKFKEELTAIAAALRAEGIECVEYHGDVSKADREVAIDKLQHGTARAFVAQAQAGGTGLTLTAAETAVYYSNDFNSGTRLQSEDRNHRIGTKSSVLYIDLAAENTIDEKIASVLQRKKNTAALILDDARPT